MGTTLIRWGGGGASMKEKGVSSHTLFRLSAYLGQVQPKAITGPKVGGFLLQFTSSG